MSWDAYMDTLEGYTQKKLKYGGIYSHDGNRWTSKGDFSPSQTEIATLVNICNNKETDKSNAQINGIHISGQKYRLLRSDAEEKTVDFTQTVEGKLRTGNVVMTKQGAVVCICEEDSKSATAKDASCKLGQYLKDSGY